MKGRPITTEEFERMLAKVPDVVWPTPEDEKGIDESRKAAAVTAWTYYLRGLWLSGLRLAESLELFWDRDDKLCVDLTGKRPMLRIPAELEKGNKDRLLPLAPEFAEFLLTKPKGQRQGRVFRLIPRKGRRETLTSWRVSRIVCAIGQTAGVKVSTDTMTGAVKFASAHDLRRSFGARWASRVMPQVLKELMRHEAIETTMKFYVGRNAQSTAEVLWAAHQAAGDSMHAVGATLGDTTASSQTPTSQKTL